MSKETPIEKILNRSDLDTSTGCWEWKLSKLSTGYGQHAVGGKPELAHRAAWRAFRGEIPADKCVCHKCDNPSCVNPGHLFIGTQGDNMRDMHKKGRWPGFDRAGENNGNSKLSNTEVAEIRVLWRESVETKAGLGRMFGCSTAHICRILSGESRFTPNE